MRTPLHIPEIVFPELDIYHIRTRIIIETQGRIEPNGNISLSFAISPFDVQKELEMVRELYKDIGLQLQIDQVVYQPPNTLDQNIRDAVKYKNWLSIYYLQSMADHAGIASCPWAENILPAGVYIYSNHYDWTLAHEIGHYFGLGHTFAEDYVSDTPEQLQKTCDREPDVRPNCHNIMNYCTHDPKTVTREQLIRMKRFMRSLKRRNHVILEPQPPVVIPATTMHFIGNGLPHGPTSENHPAEF